MTAIIQDRTLQQIRQDIGYRCDILIKATASSNGTNANIVDNNMFKPYGDDYLIGWQAHAVSGTTGNVGAKRWVTDYVSSATTAIVSPVLTNATVLADVFEFWKPPYDVDRLNRLINQAIIDVSDRCIQPRVTVNTWTQWDTYEYSCLSGFKALSNVEYVDKIGTGEVVHECDELWTAGTDVTASLDSEKVRHGSYANKLTVSANVAASALLAYKDISSIDMSNYDTVELWLLSSIDITAGDLLLLLGNTAACASPLESLSLPAISANTWTRCELTLSTPHLDTAIISVGLKQKTGVDLGACVLWVDYILALKALSRVYVPLLPRYYNIVRGTTNKLRLTAEGKNITGNNALLCLTGYTVPTLLSADTDTSTIDPDFIVNWVSGRILGDKGLLAEAEAKKVRLKTSLAQNTRYI